MVLLHFISLFLSSTKLAIDCLRSLLLFWQPYIVQMGLEMEEPGKGLEIIGIPEGIPSQAEFLAEYCLEAVSTTKHALDY